MALAGGCASEQNDLADNDTGRADDLGVSLELGPGSTSQVLSVGCDRSDGCRVVVTGSVTVLKHSLGSDNETQGKLVATVVASHPDTGNIAGRGQVVVGEQTIMEVPRAAQGKTDITFSLHSNEGITAATIALSVAVLDPSPDLACKEAYQAWATSFRIALDKVGRLVSDEEEEAFESRLAELPCRPSDIESYRTWFESFEGLVEKMVSEIVRRIDQMVTADSRRLMDFVREAQPATTGEQAYVPWAQLVTETAGRLGTGIFGRTFLDNRREVLIQASLVKPCTDLTEAVKEAYDELASRFGNSQQNENLRRRFRPEPCVSH